MKASIRMASLAILLIAALQGATSSATDASSPIGLWKTFDDRTGNPRAIVRIYEQDGKLFGRIERSFTPGAENRVCEACTDERKNQPIIGLLIIRNGTRMVVRGYIGISLLGRTQTWQRQNSL
jgi:uncharacterized protein (DUF2147 family)